MNKTRNIITAATLVFAFTGLSTGVNAASLTSAQEQTLINICKAAKSNRVFKLKQVQRDSRLSFETIAQDVKCNGEGVIEFAYQNQAYKTSNYLAKKVGRVAIQDIAKLEQSEKSNTTKL